MRKKKSSPSRPYLLGIFQLLAAVRKPTTSRASRHGHTESQHGPLPRVVHPGSPLSAQSSTSLSHHSWLFGQPYLQMSLRSEDRYPLDRETFSSLSLSDPRCCRPATTQHQVKRLASRQFSQRTLEGIQNTLRLLWLIFLRRVESELADTFCDRVSQSQQCVFALTMCIVEPACLELVHFQQGEECIAEKPVVVTRVPTTSGGT